MLTPQSHMATPSAPSTPRSGTRLDGRDSARKGKNADKELGDKPNPPTTDLRRQLGQFDTATVRSKVQQWQTQGGGVVVADDAVATDHGPENGQVVKEKQERSPAKITVSVRARPPSESLAKKRQPQRRESPSTAHPKVESVSALHPRSPSPAPSHVQSYTQNDVRSLDPATPTRTTGRRTAGVARYDAEVKKAVRPTKRVISDGHWRHRSESAAVVESSNESALSRETDLPKSRPSSSGKDTARRASKTRLPAGIKGAGHDETHVPQEEARPAARPSQTASPTPLHRTPQRRRRDVSDAEPSTRTGSPLTARKVTAKPNAAVEDQAIESALAPVLHDTSPKERPTSTKRQASARRRRSERRAEAPAVIEDTASQSKLLSSDAERPPRRRRSPSQALPMPLQPKSERRRLSSGNDNASANGIQSRIKQLQEAATRSTTRASDSPSSKLHSREKTAETVEVPLPLFGSRIEEWLTKTPDPFAADARQDTKAPPVKELVARVKAADTTDTAQWDRTEELAGKSRAKESTNMRTLDKTAHKRVSKETDASPDMVKPSDSGKAGRRKSSVRKSVEPKAEEPRDCRQFKSPTRTAEKKAEDAAHEPVDSPTPSPNALKRHGAKRKTVADAAQASPDRQDHTPPASLSANIASVHAANESNDHVDPFVFGPEHLPLRRQFPTTGKRLSTIASVETFQSKKPTLAESTTGTKAVMDLNRKLTASDANPEPVPVDSKAAKAAKLAKPIKLRARRWFSRSHKPPI